MKLVIDESVDYAIVKILKRNNYDVLSITESFPCISDDRVLEIAVQEKSLLLTEDKDFGELTFRLKKENYGIILIRLSGIPSSEKAEIALQAIQQNLEKMKHSFSVVESRKIRIRKIIL